MRPVPLLILPLFLTAALPAATPAPSPARDLRTFDFEERQLGNAEDLPMHWTKVEGPQFPHYVNARLSADRARSGEYSFRYDLNGGSLVYRYDPGRIRVLPRSHYRVETHVQTTPLANARARLTAYFVDADGRIIRSSVRHSELYATKDADEPWKHLEVELSTDRFADSLVVELALLQPEAYAAESLGKQTIYPQDIRGSAWFDDVIVSQVPRVQLSTDRPGNIFRRDDPLFLQVQVNDRSTEDLAAQLVIQNAAGQVVYQRSGALDINSAEDLGPGRKRSRLQLPSLPPGWYEASLVMTSRGQYVGRHGLYLVLLADNAPHMHPDDRFGIIATELPFDGWSELPQMWDPLESTCRHASLSIL